MINYNFFSIAVRAGFSCAIAVAGLLPCSIEANATNCDALRLASHIKNGH